MASKEITGEITLVRSHWITLELRPEPTPAGGRGPYRWGIIKEELFPSILTEWRGDSVVLGMSADRYEHSSGMSEWRVIGREARARHDADGQETTFGHAVSDLARRRLSEALAPLVYHWLRTEEYRLSRRSAIQHALARVIRDGRPTVKSADLRNAARAMLELGEISEGDLEDWGRLADLRDAYVDALEELDA
jgi:hypothetical protein